MIFTRITLTLDRVIKGSHSRTLQLRMPGGTYGGTTVFIPGLPTFELGRSYLLFLRPECEETGVPVVGVDQGYFRILDDPVTHRRVLADSESNDVIGVQGGRIIRRLPSEEPGVRHLKTELPHPAPGYSVVVPAEPGGARKFGPPTPSALTPDDLIGMVRRVPQWDKVPPAAGRGREGRP